MSTPGKGEATACFVVGLLSLLCVALKAFVLAPVLGLIGVVLAIYSRKAGYNSGLRVTGMILSSMTLVLGIVLMVLYFA